MHSTRMVPHKSLLLLPLALAALASCQDSELPTGPAASFLVAQGACVVANLADDGAGSLRAAIADATCTTINFAVTGTIPLTTSLLVDRPVTISGPAAPGITISGGNTVRVFMVTGSDVKLADLTVANGHVVGSGGGIFNNGHLTLTRVAVRGNQAVKPEDGLAYGGGIYSEGTLIVEASTIEGNSAPGGIGGGISAHAGTLHVSNSTISGNSALTAGGIELAVAGSIQHSTITANLVSLTYGGVWLSDGVVAIKGSIIAGNGVGQHAVPDLVDQYNNASTSWSLIGSTTGNSVTATEANGNLVNQDPLLGPLGDNGGPTRTHALLEASPARNAGVCTNTAGVVVTSDQRGYSRPAGSGCDMGAYEYNASAPPPPPSCEGVQIRMTRTAGPTAVAPGAPGNWIVELEVSACEDVTGVSAQGGGAGWVTTTASTSDGTIGVRKANKNSEVWLWEVGDLDAGDVVKATLGISGTVGRKVACGSELSLTGDWSATANGGAGPVKYGEAGPVTVLVCEPPPPTAVAPVAGDDDYTLTAGQTLTILAANGLLANDLLGSPGATITAVLGADGEPLGGRTVLEGTVAVDPATGAFTLTGATRAGSESFQYEITNSEGTSRGDVVITVNPGAAATMVAFAGDGQTGVANFSLLIPPAVRVTDAFDNAIAAASVAFAVTAGGGSATGLTATTTSEGVAAVGSWTLGGEAGVNTLQATSSGLTPLHFTATAVTSCVFGTPTTAAFSAISQPTTNIDNTQTRSVTLLVTDACGAPVIGAAVSWATLSSLSTTDVVTGGTTTDVAGRATASWTYYYSCGAHTVSATATGLPAVHHTLNFGTCGGGGSIRR